MHHKRTMYLLEPTEEAKAAAKKRVTVVEYEDGAVSIRYRGVARRATKTGGPRKRGARRGGGRGGEAGRRGGGGRGRGGPPGRREADICD